MKHFIAAVLQLGIRFARSGGLPIRTLLGIAALAISSGCSTLETGPVEQAVTGVPGPSGQETTVIGLVTESESSSMSGGHPDSVSLAAQLAQGTLSSGAIMLLVQPSPRDSRQAREIAGQFTQSGAKMAIGETDGEIASALSGYLSSNGIPLLSLSYTSIQSTQLYAAGFAPAAEAQVMTDEFQRREYGSVAIVAVDNPPSRALVSALAGRAAQNGIRSQVLRGDRPALWARQIVELASSGAPVDAVIFAASPQAMQETVANLGSIGSALPDIVGVAAWDVSASQPPPGLVSWRSTYGVAGLTTFRDRFIAQFGQAPTLNGALTYDLVILSAALAETEALNPYSLNMIARPAGFSGFTGQFSFSADGRITSRQLQIKSGF